MALYHTYLMRSTYSNISWSRRHSWIKSLLLRKRNSWLHPQHVSWPICGSPSSFSPPRNHRSSGESHTIVNNRLLDLLALLYQHAISTFNTCLWGPTHQSLTNPGRGYNIGHADFSHTTPRPSQPTFFTFHLRVPPGLQFNQGLLDKPKLSLRNL
jgi:hypothetical protein